MTTAGNGYHYVFTNGLLLYYESKSGTNFAFFSYPDADDYQKVEVEFEDDKFKLKTGVWLAPNMLMGCQPELCLDSRMDAMLRKKNSTDAYILYGAFAYLWNVQYRVLDNWLLIRSELSFNHRNLDAAFYEPRSNSYYYFKESSVFRENSDIGTPISTLFRLSGFNASTRIDAAVCYNDFVYLFKEEAVFKFKVMSNNSFWKADQMRITSFMRTILPHVSAATVVRFGANELILVMRRNYAFLLSGFRFAPKSNENGIRNSYFRVQSRLLDCSRVAGANLNEEKQLIESEFAKITFTSTTPLIIELSSTTSATTQVSEFTSTEQLLTTAFEILLPPPLTHPPELATATIKILINPDKVLFTLPGEADEEDEEDKQQLLWKIVAAVGLALLSVICGLFYLMRSHSKKKAKVLDVDRKSSVARLRSRLLKSKKLKSGIAKRKKRPLSKKAK
ncbi:hypothetical protein B4U79_17740 [Dinothrombium tinctorium]|uniref:Uncharacterized protein n=1 Tax=Dinothrombium tinctorium TaxID=1965070 RepID=A0A443R0Y3_9ACAR|nr:hypothetical protein B4U79_17740 [Dinothrombium tinctorium]